jgi:hypothetical protein
MMVLKNKSQEPVSCTGSVRFTHSRNNLSINRYGFFRGDVKNPHQWGRVLFPDHGKKFPSPDVEINIVQGAYLYAIPLYLRDPRIDIIRRIPYGATSVVGFEPFDL